MSGAEFLKFRRIELEDFIRYAKTVVRNYQWSLETYEYEPIQREAMEKDIEFWEKEVQYAQRDLAEMGGAENEESIVTEPRSESPQKLFTDILACVLGA